MTAAVLLAPGQATAQGMSASAAAMLEEVVLTEDQRKNDTRFFVRGVGGGFSNPAQVFGVGMCVDGHYISGSLGAFMSTVDVERVEVLRGPQASLFGYNVTDEEILFRCAEIRSGAFGRWYEAPSQWGLGFQMDFGG